jgi:hypothetical protein
LRLGLILSLAFTDGGDTQKFEPNGKAFPFGSFIFAYAD